MPVTHLSDYLEASTARFRDRVAAVDADGTTITYGELNQRADQVAGFLLEYGVRPGDRIALVLPKSVTALTALWGILKARAAYVPIDWCGPLERARAILQDCQVRAVFVEKSRIALASETDLAIVVGAKTDELTRSGRRIFDWGTVLLHNGPAKAQAATTQADDLAYILYTSGSTGIPKGVTLTHRNATSFIEWCASTFTPSENDRFSSHAPFHFDLSILDIFLPARHGASVLLIPDELGKSPKELARFIATRRLTVWYSTPAILGLLAEYGELDRLDYSALRLVLFAGEVFPVKQLRLLTTFWPSSLYYNLYGPTETNVCTFARIPLPIPQSRSEPYPIGRACSHCAALVLDSDGRQVDSGKEGLLYISGPSVFSGYWGRPKETTAAFLDRDGTRWYNTGDLVIEDSSNGFVYVGRRDRMIKRRGYRIELGEIESCLYRHPAVKSVAVVAVPHPEAGVQISAYLVVSQATRPSIIEMKMFCAHHLPPYMSPDIFVFLDVLPRTSTNKVDYQSLIRNFQSAQQRIT